MALSRKKPVVIDATQFLSNSLECAQLSPNRFGFIKWNPPTLGQYIDYKIVDLEKDIQALQVKIARVKKIKKNLIQYLDLDSGPFRELFN